MEAGMALINDLVRQAREQANLTMEYMAQLSDYSTTQIFRYEHGENEVSFRYASRLFAATGDRRVLCAFSPAAAEIVQAMANGAGGQQSTPRRTAPPGDPRDLLRRELEAIEDLTKAARYVQQIVSDGVVDESDNAMIGKLLAKHEEAAAIMAAVDRALVHYRDQSPKRK